MRTRTAALLTAFILITLPLVARERQVYFSVTTSKTFRPNEKPKVELYAHDVEVLEFRVYRVNDPLKFFQGLDDVHQFGPQYSPRDKVDERTWLERFHDWKMEWWHRIRNFFRHQYSAGSRAEIRERHSQGAQRSNVTSSAGFVDVPILNSQQLVARWRMTLPPTYVSESSDLPMDSLPAGAYVVEATDGHYRAYSVLLISQMAIVTKTSKGHLLAFTADRDSGSPVAGVLVTTWRSKQVAAQCTTDSQGLGEASIENKNQEQGGSEYGSAWVLAQHGGDVALVAPYSLNVSSDPNQDWRGYVYTDRPVYRPGDSAQFKAILRKEDGSRLLLPTERDVQVTITDAAQNQVLRKSYTLSNFGSLNGSLDLPATAALGYYSISLSKGYIVGSFQVEEYKKPDYFVKVTPEQPRVLQGASVKATIEARYYFGEPVANAKVKYVVHTQRAYFFSGEDDEEDESYGPSTEGGGDEGGPDNSRYFYGDQILEEEGTLDAAGKLVVTIPTRVEDKYKVDTEYRVEARVTDAANREIAGHNAFLATYGNFRLEVSPQSYIYKEGDTGHFTVQALDYDKRPVSTAVHITLAGYRYGGWGYSRNSSRRNPEEQSIDAQTGPDGFAHVTLPLKGWGEFTVNVTAHTPVGRDVTSSTWVWVAGQNEQTWAEGEARTLQLVADKAVYKVGDVAHVLVAGSVPDATILLTTEGNDVLTKQLVHASGANVTVDVPITVESQPNVYVSAVFIWKDAVYIGSKSLKVPPIERRLNI
ncbi:MAG TPA: MG2 domain-containing protein, partial [Terriglobales bacterium]|nr:MG2 domain-containing protein [Terriglobales bacterium]